MESILKKLRIKYTLTTTLIAGILLLVLLAAFFSLLYASTELVSVRTMADILADTDKHPETAIGRRCFIFYHLDDVNVVPVFYKGDTAYYGADCDEILAKAVEVGKGKFSVGEHYFRVSTQLDFANRQVYAVYDRTADRQMLLNVAVIIALIYFAALALIALISYLFSSRTLAPVSESFKKQRDLIANASHELKTPLTVIATDISVMKSEPQLTIADNEKWIKSIDTQIARMNGLIGNMLQLSKLEQTELPKTMLDFSEIVEGACLSFEAVCFEKNVTLITSIAKSVNVYGERDSLERLVTILLDNAVKYSGKDGKVGLKLTADKKIRLSVMNTGVSISEEEAKHVFDRFYRSDGARSNPDGNSFGLGLAIAQAIVLSHRGAISCRGNGKGTVFEVTLPLPKKRAELNVSADGRSAASASARSDRRELPPSREEAATAVDAQSEARRSLPDSDKEI